MGREGWIPVVKQKGRQDVRLEGQRKGLFTVFVDNIPNSMDPKVLYSLFMKFGIVKDVFIPQKRRKAKNSSKENVRNEALNQHSVHGIDSTRVGSAGGGRNKFQSRDHRSFADVITAKVNHNRAGTIVRVAEVGNGWLYESVIIRLKQSTSFEEFKKELKEK
ncbi:hypothetical protein ACSBR2_015635 [Camellia fascicularis]